MKIETLNIWGGRVYKPLIKHIKQQGETVDIFCFQEVFNKATTSRPIHQESVMDIFGKLGDALPEHTGYFDPAQDNEEGLATFIKKSIPLQKHGNILSIDGKVQWLIMTQEHSEEICNISNSIKMEKLLP